MKPNATVNESHDREYHPHCPFVSRRARSLVPVFLGAAMMCCEFAAAQDQAIQWNGFERVAFTLADRPCFLTKPAIPAPGNPWVWRTSFPDYHIEVDLKLLRSGWAVGYIECLEMLGGDQALELMDRFYQEVTSSRGMSVKPALEAVSRGGLAAYRYAARHPDRIACIYADVPVMDLASWPLQTGGRDDVANALRHYGFEGEAELRGFRGNPLDLLEPIAKAGIPLRHVISLNDKVVPPEQNTLEAMRRLKKLGHTIDVITVGEGTPESLGHHFPLPQAAESARFIMRHTTTLPKGREYFALRDGLGNSRLQFERRKTGRVVFLGGSITYAPGWRDGVMSYLRQRFPETQFDFVAAGVPSLGSVLHAFRLERDVLARGPVDLVFVEAAVNDHNYDGSPHAAALALRGMEGVVRHLRLANPLTDVVQFHFVHDLHLATWGKGDVPYTVAAHDRVAEQYGCPSLNLSKEVHERIAAGELSWEDFGGVHPSPFGQQLYANSMIRMLEEAFAAGADKIREHPLPDPLDPASYFRGRFGDLRSAKLSEGFVLDPSWQPTDGTSTREGYVGVPALVGSAAGAKMEFSWDGTAAGLMITSGPDAGTIAYSIDGKPEQEIETRTPSSDSLHLPWAVILADDLPPGRHTVRVRVVTGALRVFQLLEN